MKSSNNEEKEKEVHSPNLMSINIDGLVKDAREYQKEITKDRTHSTILHR